MANVFKIKITKAKRELDVVFDDLPDEMKLYVVQHGLEKLLNGATAKETATTTPDEKVRGENAYALAQKKLESLIKGEVKVKKSKSTLPAVVVTEAKRLAKIIVKQQIKAANEKISDYTAKAITEAATAYLEGHPELFEEAKASIEKSEALAKGATVNVAAIPISAEKKAKREALNAARKAETAAKNAGKPGGQKSTLKAQAKPGAKPVPTKPKAPGAQPTA